MLVTKEEGGISNRKLETMLKEGVKNNGVIFDDEETRQMVDLLMMECQEELDLDDIEALMTNHPELGYSLSYRCLKIFSAFFYYATKYEFLLFNSV